MLTRTSARELFETDGILMTSVDTGWITDERPHPTKVRLAEEGFHAPLDLVDGAARVYDPIVRGAGRRRPVRRLPEGLRALRLVGHARQELRQIGFGILFPPRACQGGPPPGGHRSRASSAARACSATTLAPVPRTTTHMSASA